MTGLVLGMETSCDETAAAVVTADGEVLSSIVSRARPPRATGFNTVQDAVDAGLQVMRLQTLEYPDGRRVDVLTRLPPEDMERVLSRPYPRY